tara:strand:- start:554 stop:949 length:396 start_codon:yes stop_codon:yes gene_type:complete
MRCKHCTKLLDIVDKNKALQSVLTFHDVNKGPIPPQLKPYITTVPSMFTKDQKVLTGKEIFDWVGTMIKPKDDGFTGWDSGFGAGLDGDDGDGGLFDLDGYGVALKPEISEDLQSRIDKDVNDAYNSANNK